jgi:hypothetical protein
MGARHTNSTFIDIDIDIGKFAALFTREYLIRRKVKCGNPEGGIYSQPENAWREQ